MEAKFLIFLFVTVFYNGVTCIPAGQIVVPDEAKIPPTPTVAIDHNNAQTPAPTSNSSINSTKVPEGVVISNKTSENPVAPPSGGNTTVPVITPDSKKPTVTPKNETSADTHGNDTAKVIPATPVPEKPTVTTITPATSTNSTAAPEVSTPGNATVQPLPSTTTTKKPITTTKAGTTKPSTTPAPSTSTTTEGSSAGEEHKTETSEQRERQFDGASFVGGIVLTVGLTAIGFIAFKYFKAGKIEMDYRTL